MLSVCVPVFNTDVRELATQLADQARNMDVPLEIIFLDDDSTPSFKDINRKITDMQGVLYEELKENMGRAAIRNYLARKAHYPYVLYLDSDSLLPDNDFLRRYMDCIAKSRVVCGGTLYNNFPPGEETMLRWVYGKKREQLTAEQRNRKGFAITANNFLIAREVILQHPFRENIRGYGHEDTVLGYDLSVSGIPVLHIDNPVLHTGLENSADYLAKTRKAIENLWYIAGNLVTDESFHNHSGLLRFRRRIQSLGLLPFTRWVYRRLNRSLQRKLTGKSPRLWMFDLYRLLYMCNL
jgi:glycosyltransferase involved in cell wall biosynthesis